MRKIKLEALLRRSAKVLFEGLRGDFLLEFDDGEVIETRSTDFMYSYSLWGPLIKRDPRRISKEHHCCSYGRFTNSWITGIISAVYKTCESVIDSTSQEELNDLRRDCFNSINVLHNHMVVSTVGYKLCLDRVAVDGLYRDPLLVKYRDLIEKDKITIAQAYKDVLNVINNDDKYADNTLGRMIRCKGVKSDQAMQSILARGYVTDVGGAVFPVPVKSCFFKGLSLAYDMAAESRSATKALAFANALIGQAEYFTRKLRTACSYMQHVFPGDCGSEKYLEWFVKPENNETGVRSDLFGLVGKNYLTKNGLREVTADDKHLIGKTIKLRSVKLCHRLVDQGVCSVCFGGMYANTHGMMNIGQRSALTIGPPIVQEIISVKHSDTIGSLVQVILKEEASVIFISADKGIALKKEVNHELVMIFTSEDAPGIIDLTGNGDEQRKVIVKRLSNINNIGYYYKDDPSIISNVSVVSKPLHCSFSEDMVDHISRVGIAFDDRGNYCVDMTDWKGEFIFTVPNVSHGKIDDIKRIERMIEGRMDDKSRMVEGSAIEMISCLYDAISQAINVNLSVVEVVVTAISIDGYENQSISLADGGNRLGQIHQTMSRRSIAVLMGMEERRPTLMSAAAHFPEDRMPNPMDAFIMPYEVIANNKRKEKEK